MAMTTSWRPGLYEDLAIVLHQSIALIDRPLPPGRLAHPPAPTYGHKWMERRRAGKVPLATWEKRG